ncbi:MAG: DMT family transporter [Alphaproteobacteria bacterium]|nr:DMT family transporter [Alphaproteobacteria bacterium]
MWRVPAAAARLSRVKTDKGPRPDLRALLLAPLGAILIGAVPYFAVGLQRSGMDTASILFWRYFFALSLLLPIALLLRQKLRAGWNEGGRGLFLTSLTLGAFQTFCYFRAVELIPTSVAVLFFYAYPLMTLLLQRVLQGRQAPLQTLFACLLILAGAGAMAHGALWQADLPLAGLLLAAIVPVTYGFYAIRMATLAGRLPSLPAAIFIQLGLLASYAAMTLVSGLSTGGDAWTWLQLFAIASIGSAIPMFIMAYSLPRLGAAGFGVMSSFELVTVVFFGVLLLGEQLTPTQWIGVACVLGGMLIYRPAAERRAGPG